MVIYPTPQVFNFIDTTLNDVLSVLIKASLDHTSLVDDLASDFPPILGSEDDSCHLKDESEWTF